MTPNSHYSHHVRHATDAAMHVAQQMAPLPEKKEPIIAALFGFLLGGIGLGLYFKSFKDFVVPVALWVFCVLVLGLPTGGMSAIAAGIFCAAYGFRRAKASNAAREQQEAEAMKAEPPSLPSALGVSSPAKPGQSIREKLADLKAMLNDGDITDNEYAAKKEELLKAL